MARNHLLSLSFSVDIYAKSSGERISRGAFVSLFILLGRCIKLRKILQISYTISLIINKLNQIFVAFSGALFKAVFQPFSTVCHSRKWPHR